MLTVCDIQGSDLVIVVIVDYETAHSYLVFKRLHRTVLVSQPSEGYVPSTMFELMF